MFFARYNVHPLAEVRVQDTDKLKAELEKILSESPCLFSQLLNIMSFRRFRYGELCKNGRLYKVSIIALFS